MGLKDMQGSNKGNIIQSDGSDENFLSPEVSPIPEGGWGWVCVLGRFYTHFLLLGSMTAFGVMYLELIEYFQTTRTEAAWVGSLAGGLSMFVGPISGLMTEKFGCRVTTMVGALVAAFGVFISWFANGIIFLCVTFGVIAGSGIGLTFIPSAVIIFQYFKRRRAFASAIGSTGGGIGSMVLPVVYALLIDNFGWRGTMWIISGFMLQAVVCGALFRPPEYVRQAKALPKDRYDTENKNCCTKTEEFFSVFKNRSFFLFFVGTMLTYFGYGVPIVHMPDLACQRGVAKEQVPYLLSIMGVSGVILRVPIAWASDFKPISRTLILGVALMCCGSGTFVCPHLFAFPAFSVYAVIQGGGMGIWGALIAVITADIVKPTEVNKGIGFLIFSGGIATIISSPLAGWMYDVTGTYIASFYFAGVVYIISGLLTVVVFIIELMKSRRQDKHSDVMLSTSVVTAEPI